MATAPTVVENEVPRQCATYDNVFVHLFMLTVVISSFAMFLIGLNCSSTAAPEHDYCNSISTIVAVFMVWIGGLISCTCCMCILFGRRPN